jgi:hypothetical protein
MPKKIERGDKYIEAAVEAIKGAGSLRELYIAIHDEDPSRLELQRFANRLNSARSNPGTDMLGLCIEHLPQLHEMTLGEFFGIKKSKK